MNDQKLSFRLKMIVVSAMTMAVFTSFSIIAFPKIFNFWGFKTTCGDFFFPLTYTITDLIAFFYGKALAKYIFKTSIGLDVIFSICGIILYYIPADPSFKQQHVYYYLFVSHGIRLSSFAAIGIYLSQQLNLTLFFSRILLALSFPLRSSLSSVPSDFLISLFAIIPTLYTDHTLKENMSFVINSVITKCIISTIYAFFLYTIVRHVTKGRNTTTSIVNETRV